MVGLGAIAEKVDSHSVSGCGQYDILYFYFISFLQLMSYLTIFALSLSIAVKAINLNLNSIRYLAVYN